MNRHLAIAGGLGLAAAVALWWLTGSPAPGVPDAAPAGGLVQVEPSARVTRPVPVAPEPSDPPAADEAAPSGGAEPVPRDPAWPELHGRFRRVMSGRVEIFVPDDATEFEAHDLQMDVIDARTSELDALIVELTELAETTTDSPTRADALVSLGEVYLELDDTLADTPIPDWMRPRRARRLQTDVDQQRAIAVDKARMVFQMAEPDAAGSHDLTGRIRDGLAATE